MFPTHNRVDRKVTELHRSSATVLVVGGAGYIGSHVAQALRREGYNAIIYDNFSTGHRELVQGFEVVEGDIREADKLRHSMRRVDAVMHFAAHAYVGESVEQPRKYFHNNVLGSLSLLDAALDARLKVLIFSSTCAVYGVPDKLPITENTARRPVNPYGVSKLFVEQALEAYGHAYGLKFAILRYFNAAGADELGEIGECHDPETHLIPLALEAAAGYGPVLRIYGNDYPTADGTCIRDYIHVNDLAAGHVKALRHLLAGGSSLSVNLGTGCGYSIAEVLTTIEEVTGMPVRTAMAARRPGDPPVLVADATRARELLQWQAARSLRTTISTAWNWMQLRRTGVPEELPRHELARG